MKWALDLRTGAFASVEELQRLRLPDVSRSALSKDIICTECGNPVTLSHTKGGETFFSHLKMDSPRNTNSEALRNCPLSFYEDPKIVAAVKAKEGKKIPRHRPAKFEILVARAGNPAECSRVRAVLREPAVMRYNKMLMEELYFKMTRDYLPRSSLELMMDRALRDFGACGLLGSHPYLLPYMKMATSETFARRGNGGYLTVRPAQRGAFYLRYQDRNGRRHQAVLPDKIELLCATGKGWAKMIRSETTVFDISLEAAVAFIGAPPAVILELKEKTEGPRPILEPPRRPRRRKKSRIHTDQYLMGVGGLNSAVAKNCPIP